MSSWSLRLTGDSFVGCCSIFVWSTGRLTSLFYLTVIPAQVVKNQYDHDSCTFSSILDCFRFNASFDFTVIKQFLLSTGKIIWYYRKTVVIDQWCRNEGKGIFTLASKRIIRRLNFIDKWSFDVWKFFRKLQMKLKEWLM